jgi:hypothetical protein
MSSAQQPDASTAPDAANRRFDDQINLRSGSEIEARVIAEPESEKRRFVVFETEFGSIVKLDRKLVQSVLAADEDLQRYRQLRSRLPQTVEANWEMIDWCKSQSRGRTKFKDEIQYHLENIISIPTSERLGRCWATRTSMANGPSKNCGIGNTVMSNRILTGSPNWRNRFKTTSISLKVDKARSGNSFRDGCVNSAVAD